MEHYFVFDSKGFSDYCYWQSKGKIREIEMTSFLRKI